MYHLRREHARRPREAELATVKAPRITGNQALDTVHLHLDAEHDTFTLSMTREDAEAPAAWLAAVVERTRRRNQSSSPRGRTGVSPSRTAWRKDLASVMV